MSDQIEIKVPDIGDFDDVPVIEVLVSAGDAVEAEDSLITLESDKATMEVPAPQAGTITEVRVSTDDRVSQGDVIALMEAADSSAESGAEEEGDDPQPSGDGSDTSAGSSGPESGVAGESSESSQEEPVAEAETDVADAPMDDHDYDCDLLVLGSGPGGYTAAFRAADLGLDVILVERYPSLGGVCLNVGCIPSKALLHAARVIDEAASFADHGIRFGEPDINSGALGEWKDSVVDKLTGGLAGMARKRGVTVVQGEGQFMDDHRIRVSGGESERTLSFGRCIIAAGSEPVHLDHLPWDDPRVMDSTGALRLKEIPERLLVIGGGIIGLEMACVYEALGSRVTVVEMQDQLMPGADKDLVKPLHQRIAKRYDAIYLNTRVTGVNVADDGLHVALDGDSAPANAVFDRVLVAVGRVPNGQRLGLENTAVEVTDRGFIPVDKQMRTNVDHLFAIGDIVGQPMLAHKATHEGKVAAEVCAGEKAAFDARVVPSVAYTDPEVAWVGVTEGEAKEQDLNIGVGKFPWAASGRALGIGRPEGFTKLLFDNNTDRIVGGGIVGPNAGDLIAEVAHAIEMGATAHDIGATIHPHPTLSETVAFAAEAYEGTITDLYIPKK